jgi:hypothetical protein
VTQGLARFLSIQTQFLQPSPAVDIGFRVGNLKQPYLSAAGFLPGLRLSSCYHAAVMTHPGKVVRTIMRNKMTRKMTTLTNALLSRGGSERTLSEDTPSYFKSIYPM